MNIRTSILLILFGVLTAQAQAQALGEIAFRQSLLDLTTDLRLLCVAAHPDDEDGATLAYYRMMHGVETHAIIATRGEGGQNEIGPELYNELGVIRTREMEAAAVIEGAELHFLNLPEFGYSKSPDETLEVWGKDVAMERMVRVIRETRPHVIITNHGRLNDHGHHQAIGAVLEEAFDLAADPTLYPAHANSGLEPWQPLRLYIREFRGGEGTIATDISRLEPMRGKTIAEIAASALEVHKSQGMKFFIDLLLSTQPKTFYNRVKNERGEPGQSPLEGFGPLFDGLPWAARTERPVLDPAHTDRATATATLLGWLATHADYRTGSFDEQKLWSTVNRAACIAMELRLRATTRDAVVSPGQALTITVKLEDFGHRDAIQTVVSLREVHGFGEVGNHRFDAPLFKTGSTKGDFSITVPLGAEITLPLAPRLFEQNFLRPQLVVEAEVNCGDAPITISAPVYVDVAEPLSITCLDAPYLVAPTSGEGLPVRLLVTNNSDSALSEYVGLSVPEGWTCTPVRRSVSFSKEDEQRFVTFMVVPPADLQSGDYAAYGHVYSGKKQYELLFRAVDVVVPTDARVGVIESYDDTFVSTLEKLGVPHERLEADDFVPEHLDTFTTIIIDIRAYQYRPELVANNSVLLDYVVRGGNVLTMYQKTFDWNAEYAPYPITLSRNRVTREDAPVTLLQPEHPLFTTPNKISAGDWDGWIQERGLYFPEAWHAAYTPLIAMEDPGEEIPPGSYLVASSGEGRYIYTALGWYRQLRELHPGALRCFANMLSH